MIAQTYRELVCWQLAIRVRDETVALIPSFPRPQHRNLCDQLRRAVSSPPDNIAEGFGRFAPVDFARFLSFAIGSLDEADGQLRQAAAGGCMEPSKVAPVLVLIVRCRKANISLRRYLLTKGPEYIAAWKARQRRRS